MPRASRSNSKEETATATTKNLSWASVVSGNSPADEIPHPLTDALERAGEELIQAPRKERFSAENVLQANAALGIEIPDAPILEAKTAASPKPPPRKKAEQPPPKPKAPVRESGHARLVKACQRYWQRHGAELSSYGLNPPDLSTVSTAALADHNAECRTLLSDVDEMDLVQNVLVYGSALAAIYIAEPLAKRNPKFMPLALGLNTAPDALASAYQSDPEYRRALSIASIDIAGVVNVGPWGKLLSLIAKHVVTGGPSSSSSSDVPVVDQERYGQYMQ